MTDREEDGRGGEGFVGRWSRLKRRAQVEPPAESPVTTATQRAPRDPPPADPVDAAPPAEISAVSATGDEQQDLSDLPSLDSLDAASDYTGFLRKEVPAELRRQALRKAWASDPAIAGFRGFAEYDWDFNAPGYGALLPTDDIARLVDRIFPTPETEPEEPDTAAVAAAERERPPQDDVAEAAAEPPPQPSPAADGNGSGPAGCGGPLSQDREA
ncbi:DUF3306 domain-containing protein [Azospirillum picis]|uniref:DUF3306 domain-containing protein n=1 Tax=Azospirillum picis TaxID=488438 RepID=A0ABU0MDQ0_9PROT|nr:DUF3306 domain-containing protein [Azospirillum picis]MBP2297412.1 hypothetical protein [Azospirillum picis]MDQ0531565.1 hypothetical protein [Azospirillum picis]